MKHVVVGIIINPEKKILISQRLPHQAKPGYWEFPGGKVEDGEEAFDALRREFFEELGIRIVEAIHWMKVEHSYEHADVLLDTWMIKDYIDEPHGKDGQAIEWIGRDELLKRKFPEGNAKIIEALKVML